VTVTDGTSPLVSIRTSPKGLVKRAAYRAGSTQGAAVSIRTSPKGLVKPCPSRTASRYHRSFNPHQPKRAGETFKAAGYANVVIPVSIRTSPNGLVKRRYSKPAGPGT